MCSTNHFLADLPEIDADLSEVHVDPSEVAEVSFRNRLTTAADAIAYITGGKAFVTLVSVKTKKHFTFRVSASDDGTAYFVGLLSGPDNTTDYQYLGRISRGIFWVGRKTPRPGDIGKDAPSAKAFDWAWRALSRGVVPVDLEIWHEGRCGRCGLRLTRPDSVARGFGPECINKI